MTTTTNLHLVSKLRICGAIPPLLHVFILHCLPKNNDKFPVKFYTERKSKSFCKLLHFSITPSSFGPNISLEISKYYSILSQIMAMKVTLPWDTHPNFPAEACGSK
jgi:hypothetical protein